GARKSVSLESRCGPGASPSVVATSCKDCSSGGDLSPFGEASRARMLIPWPQSGHLASLPARASEAGNSLAHAAQETMIIGGVLVEEARPWTVEQDRPPPTAEPGNGIRSLHLWLEQVAK